MARKLTSFDLERFITTADRYKTILRLRKGQLIFSQGETTDAVFYILMGKVKVTVVSQQGKEAVVAILERGAFVGESCLVGRTLRSATATTLEDSQIICIDKAVMLRLLQEQPRLAEAVLSYVLVHSIRVHEDLVDHLFNSSEQRLARALLLLAKFGKEGKPETAMAKVSQETLAEMVGTTRPRVNFFMNKFRKLGFIDYQGGSRRNGVLHVHRSLLKVVLHDQGLSG